MKKIVLFLLLAISGSISYGQCTNCTITISSNDPNTYVVSAGQTLCITSTGNLEGYLVVSGGRVCNDGIISTDSVYISSGDFTNNNLVQSAHFLVQGNDVNFENNGIMDMQAFAFYGTGVQTFPAGVNSAGANITADSISFADCSFDNYGYINADFDLSLVSGANVSNLGGFFMIFRDITVGTMATLSNSGGMEVGRDYSVFGTFQTDCIVNVGNNFMNQGMVSGHSTGASCGGLQIGGLSSNFADFGTDNSNLDICNSQGNGGFTLQNGTLGANVTNCVCSNTCDSGLGIEDEELIEFKMFPNPSSGITEITSDQIIEELLVTDLQGRQVMRQRVKGYSTHFNGADLGAGVYVVSLRFGQTWKQSKLNILAH